MKRLYQCTAIQSQEFWVYADESEVVRVSEDAACDIAFLDNDIQVAFGQEIIDPSQVSPFMAHCLRRNVDELVYCQDDEEELTVGEVLEILEEAAVVRRKEDAIRNNGQIPLPLEAHA